MQKELRKNENRLAVSGLAVIAFGLWSIVKSVIRIFVSGRKELDEVFGADNPGVDTLFLYLVLISLAFMLLELGLRIYVGLTARAESRGKKKTVVYLILSVLLAALSVYGIVSILQSGYSQSLPDLVISLLVELTSLFATAELFYSAVKVKQLRKQTEKGGE